MARSIAVGIDIGGTKIAVAAVTAEGTLLSRVEIATEAARGFPDGLRRITALVRRAMAEAGDEEAALAAIGIGCPGPLDPLAGTIDNPYTLPTWDGVDIVTPLRTRFGVPVALENDADAAAMGECWLGAGRGGRTVVMVTIGTGIGGGVIVDGRIYRGAGGAHPEIGHLALDPDGPACYCGIAGCWESLASGSAIAEAARKRLPAHDAETITGERVIAMARAGDPIARAVVDRAAQATARGVFSLINLYLPDIVVLGGGVMAAYDLFAPVIHDVVSRDTMAPVGQIAVRRAALGNDAGLYGAARIAFGLRRGAGELHGDPPQ
ncbi:MAG: ROK family protein [Anaerolineae bacterium]|nr:ROK family protein [Anaerolineae bacterium]